MRSTDDMNRVYIPKTLKIMTSNHVVFNEKVFFTSTADDIRAN